MTNQALSFLLSCDLGSTDQFVMGRFLKLVNHFRNVKVDGFTV